MESQVSKCIFCASPTAPTIQQANGDDNCAQQYLKLSFVLKHILKIPQDALCQLVDVESSQSIRKILITACVPCGTSLRQYFNTLKLMSRLETRLADIETELNGKLHKSIEMEAQGDDKSSFWNVQQFQSMEEEEHAVAATASEPSHELGNEIAVSNQSYEPFKDPYSEFQHVESESNCQPIVEEFKVNVEYINAESSSDGLNDRVGCPEDGEDVDVPSVPILENGYSFPSTQNASVSKQTSVLISPPKSNLDSSLFTDSDKSPQSSKDSGSEYEPMTSTKRRKLETSKTASQLQTSRPSIRHYSHRCSQCPFSSPNKLQLDIHSKLHEEGSIASVCPDCGWYVRPNKINVHRGTRHKSSNNITKPKSNPGLILKIFKPPIGTKGRRRAGADKKYHYQCQKCPFKTTSKVHLNSHLEAHGEGFQGVTCSDCGWYVLATKLNAHRVRRHQSIHPVTPSELPLESIKAKISSTNTNQSSMQSVKVESQPGTSTRQGGAYMGNGTAKVSVSTHLKALRYNWLYYQKKRMLEGQLKGCGSDD